MCWWPYHRKRLVGWGDDGVHFVCKRCTRRSTRPTWWPKI